MSSSGHVDNQLKDIFILGEEPTQGLDDTILIAEAIHPINFPINTTKQKICIKYTLLWKE